MTTFNETNDIVSDISFAPLRLGLLLVRAHSAKYFKILKIFYYNLGVDLEADGYFLLRFLFNTPTATTEN
ncbi:hypothetical protein HZS_1214 [Henneguya salminicola]|nr:hypothetical protein HZS_1214 [Henneguya salminicola]